MSYPNPILNLDFVNAKQLGDKVAFSRLSPRIFTSRLDAPITAADGVPCFDHDATTGICKGLYIRPQETIESTVYAADIASVDLMQLKGAAGESMWNGSSGTVLVRAKSVVLPASGQEPYCVFMIGDGSWSNYVYCVVDSYGSVYLFHGGSGSNGQVAIGYTTNGGDMAVAVSLGASPFKGAVNGQAAVSVTAGAMSSANTLFLGRRHDNYQIFNNCIASVQLYSHVLAPEYLASMSAL